ncbi:unnamed protein product, partial [Discosporangium mesarthrocarpum]
GEGAAWEEAWPGQRGGSGLQGKQGEEVDFSVVDYVLRKPFSDETLRGLLSVVEDDHKQVPLLLGSTVEGALTPIAAAHDPNAPQWGGMLGTTGECYPSRKHPSH